MNYLSNNGVDLVVLPAHTTHVMQPFDVCMSAPFKSHVSQILKTRMKAVTDVLARTTTQAAKKRLTLVHAMLLAWSFVKEPLACSRAFECCGLCPFSPGTVLSNRYGREDSDAVLETAPRQMLRGKAFTPQVIADLSMSTYGVLPLPVTAMQVMDRSGTLEQGIVFSPPHPSLAKIGPQQYRPVSWS